MNCRITLHHFIFPKTVTEIVLKFSLIDILISEAVNPLPRLNVVLILALVLFIEKVFLDDGSKYSIHQAGLTTSPLTNV